MTKILNEFSWEIGKKIATGVAGYLKKELSHKLLVDNTLVSLSDYLNKEGKASDTNRIINNIRTALTENPIDVKSAGENFHQPEVLAAEFTEKSFLINNSSNSYEI